MTDTAAVDYVVSLATDRPDSDTIVLPPMSSPVPRWFPDAPEVNLGAGDEIEVVLSGGRVLRDRTPERWATTWLKLYGELCAKARAGEHISDFYARDLQKIEAHADVPSSWGDPTERTCPTCSGKGTVPF